MYHGTTMQLSSRNPPSKCHVPIFFALWYALNVAYNITNKWALEAVHKFVDENTSHASALPFTIGCLQFGVGTFYACTLWVFLRPLPDELAEELSIAANIAISYARKLCRWTARVARTGATDPVYTPTNRTLQRNIHETTSPKNHQDAPFTNLRQTCHIAIHHTLGQICTVISLSANSIGFAHVVKAMEPFFSAIVSRIVLGQRMDIRVYLSLIPVVGGVVMACAGSPEFSWVSFLAGMSSNAFFAMRGVVSKIAMESSKKPQLNTTKNLDECIEMNNEETPVKSDVDDTDTEKDHGHPQSTMSPANLFAAVTCISFIFSIPLALLVEGNILVEVAHLSTKANPEKEIQSNIHQTILSYILLSGLFHYLNNEVMYLVLSNVHPITLAVGNTMKRVFIIVAGVIVFSTPVTLQTAVGSTIGIGGVFLYSLMKQWYGTGSDTQSADATICSMKAH